MTAIHAPDTPLRVREELDVGVGPNDLLRRVEVRVREELDAGVGPNDLLVSAAK